jgi:amidase
MDSTEQTRMSGGSPDKDRDSTEQTRMSGGSPDKDRSDYQQLDATDLAASVRSGDVSPGELAELARERYLATNDELNAIVEWYTDPTPVTTTTGPLAGVPFLVKDYGSAEAGRLVQMGSRLGVNNRATTTARFISRLQEAGAQILGRTAAPEFVQHGATETQLNGITRNPYNLERSPGGSSGGAGAAVAAGVVPVAHGSDCAGSIRIPAATCGLVGLKPGLQRIRLDDGGWGGIANEFVLSRTVRDSRLFLDVLGDGPYSATPDRPLRIAMNTDHWSGADEDEEVVAATRGTANRLRSLGHEIVVVPPPVDYEKLMGTFLALFHKWIVHDVDRLVASGGVESDETLEPLTRRALARLRRLTMEETLEAEVAGGELTMDLERAMEGFDLLLTPTLARSEIPIGVLAGDVDDYDEYLRLNNEVFAYNYLFNVSGWPSMSIPAGTNANGMPIGVQLSAALGSEHVLLDLAESLG